MAWRWSWSRAAAAVFAFFFIGLTTVSSERVGPQTSTGAPAQSRSDFTPLEEQAVRRIVRQYILENPEVVLEALEILQRRQQQAEVSRSRNAISSLEAELFRTPTDPFLGKPDAKITIVEFFDYHCPYCKRMAGQLAKFVADNPDVRLVYKEFPVFGADSTFATRAALAAQKQGMEKYQAFHLGLMGARGLSEALVLRAAGKADLDMAHLRRDMEAPDIEATIQANYDLARRLGVSGTPGFVIGDQLIPGAIDMSSMQALINRMRGG